MPAKILIVDDDLETLRLVGMMLQRQGYVIAAASTGAQAVSMAKSEDPDLVLLDIMMPDVDGYQVARQLRADAAIATVPILMFTAKTQIEDKVTGYEAGADDYITKPTHPAELNAHIQALLNRAAKSVPAAAAEVEPAKGYVAAVMGVRGGVGTSTVALNLAVTLAQKHKLVVNAAEYRPGNGAWALELGYVDPEGLHNLVQHKPEDITRELLNQEVIPSAYGVRFLLASNRTAEVDAVNSTAQFEAVTHQLAATADLTLIDVGSSQLPCVGEVLALCNEVILVLDPHPMGVARAKLLIEDLVSKGFGKGRMITVVMVNRLRSDAVLSWSQVQDTLSQPIAVTFTPVPELAYQAAVRLVPLVMLQPEGLHAQQFTKLAEFIAQHAHKE